MKAYIYQRSNGPWVCGEQDVAKKQPYLYLELPDSTHVVVKLQNGEIFIESILATEVVKNIAGEFYADQASLIAATVGLFVQAPVHVKKSKLYRVFLSQTDTENPVESILEDAISGIAVTRSDVGTSLFTKVGAFVVGDSVPKIAVQMIDTEGNKLILTPFSVDAYKLETYNSSEVLSDDILNGHELNIEIYQ